MSPGGKAEGKAGKADRRLAIQPSPKKLGQKRDREQFSDEDDDDRELSALADVMQQGNADEPSAKKRKKKKKASDEM